MKNSEEKPFNHEESSSLSACGLENKNLEVRYAESIDKINNMKGRRKSSQLTEILQEEFNERELAYLLTMKILQEQEESPMEKFLAAMDKSDGSEN